MNEVIKMKGTVKWFNVRKSYGFITGEDGKDYFAHSTEISGETLVEGQSVTFDPAQGDKGPQAKNIK
jgi:CspA family cold shock protein